MKLLLKIFFVLLTYAAVIFAAEKDVEGRTKTYKVNKGGTLTVRADPGNIIVDTWNQNKVFIELVGSGDADLDEVRFEKRGNEILVQSNFDSDWKESCDFYVKVPKNFHLNLETSAGSVELINNLIGRAKLYSSGGNIETEDLQGELSIRTLGGNVRTANINGRLNIETQGGNVSTGELKGEKVTIITRGGEIDVASSESGINAKTYGGDITMGNIGGDASVITYGGDILLKNVDGSVSANTYGGDIGVSSANGFVDVKTNGGSLSLKNISGSVEAKTNAGDIYIELTPSSKGSSYVKTSVGEIELRIPSTADAEITSIINTYSSYESGHKVISDYKSNVSKFNKNSGKITEIIKLNNATHEIILKTTSSDIKIKNLKSSGEPK